jgi:urease accessory protein
MIWLSPAYPVGAYSYSHGLEWIVEAGQIKDAETLVAWIEDLLAHGAGRSDVIFLTEAWRALLAETAQAYAQAFAANIVSAAVRLVPLGQSDGLRVQARLEPLIPRIVAAALACTLDDVGGAAVAADIASMRHETQYTRLFRS